MDNRLDGEDHDSSSQLDPVFKAQWLFKQHKYDDCIAHCTELLAANPYDQAVWYLKCRSLTLQAWVDDTDFEEEGVADALLDENATASLPRPGTSLSRPVTGTAVGQPGIRPVSSSGRPLSGFARPGTGSARPGSQGGIEGAMQARPGTSQRPVTALGRLVRLGTASMLSESGGPFIRVERLDLKKYAQRPELAKVLFDYILYHDHNPIYPKTSFVSSFGRSLAAGWRALVPHRKRGRIVGSATDSAVGQEDHQCAAPIPSPAVSGPGNNTHRPLALCSFAACTGGVRGGLEPCAASSRVPRATTRAFAARMQKSPR